MTPVERGQAEWWASLNHGGLLITPARLEEFFPSAPERLRPAAADRLRREVLRFENSADHLSDLLDVVLQEVCELGAPGAGGGEWLKGAAVSRDKWSHASLTGEQIKPRWVWSGPRGAALPLFDDDAPRLGIGRGRQRAARVVEWLRNAERPLALLTNGHQWRLVYAGLDHDAFAEWDSALWFEEGQPGPQITALRALLSPRALTAPEGAERSPLLDAIEASRRGQAELSAALGERVRQAVELLIREHGAAFSALSGVAPRDIYLAACRVVMRMVVALFAESRDLLPRDNPVYHGSYGLQGLRESLERLSAGAGRERLRQRRGAWPRMLALFRLIHDGSAHETLPIPRYGGGLFEPGAADSSDPVAKALAVLESTGDAAGMSDWAVARLLELLTRAEVVVRQGRAARRVTAPVDFADLGSEYIGIVYEGLLDFELHRAPDNDPVVFLAVGDELALRISRLEAQTDDALKALLEKLRKKEKPKLAVGDEDAEEEEDEEPEEPEVEEAGADPEPPDGQDPAEPEPAGDDAPELDEADAVRQRVAAWARRGALAAGLVARPRDKRPSAGAEAVFKNAVEQAARSLVARVIHPGEWYLVRFGGTRKGSGTFYTRPALAIPTVQRTLRPLAYSAPLDASGQADEDAPASAWTPKRPEDILALKVVDPACGSGSFLVGGLRFLTRALSESLHHHGRLKENGPTTLVTLAEGKPGGKSLAEETLPATRTADDFEARLEARLKRYVVERCLYGVDLDPLAVELCRLALWVETMDRELPFSFLDHKVRCGNALVGCWFDRFRDYPAMAWEREGGDKSHSTSVHFPRNGWTRALGAFRSDIVKPSLKEYIVGARTLWDRVEGATPEALHEAAVRLLEEMHALPVHEVEARAAFWRERVAGNPAFARLREAFDLWCALWFWPADRLADAPLPLRMDAPSDEARAAVRALTAEHRFFHWELEFPEVFDAAGGGFDAVVGNPPWEIQKPNSKEFFSNLDPLYRALGKQVALDRQKELFHGRREDEEEWLRYNARYKALSAFTKFAAEPFGDRKLTKFVNGEAKQEFDFSFGRMAASEELHGLWQRKRPARAGFTASPHPFRHQGSADLNTYKLFLEQGYSLLRAGGRMGVIVPSGLYTDKGTTALRSLFLNQGRWRWLFGFENREAIFDIHRSFKFCPVIIEKGGRTESIRTAFMRRDVGDWAVAEKIAIPYERARVERFSPRTRAILEIREKRDLEVLEKIYANSVLLGDDGPDGWGIKYATEFHMTNDSRLFPPRPKWEADGYRGDEYGRWLKGAWRARERGTPAGPERPRSEMEPGVILSQDGSAWVHETEIEGVALPLYEGRMIGQFDFSQKGWVSGKGRGAVWRDIEWSAKRLEPQYLMGLAEYQGEMDREGNPKYVRGIKLAFMDITSATNERTMISTLVNDFPCGNSAPILHSSSPHGLGFLLNSFVYDFVARSRCGGLHLNYFVIDESPLPFLRRLPIAAEQVVCSLAFPFTPFAVEWHRQRRILSAHPTRWHARWAITPFERLRLAAFLDAIAAALYELSSLELNWILRDCDYPAGQLPSGLDPKGFWRVDKERDPELRHTVLTLAAFRDLEEHIKAAGGNREQGISAFLSQNNGEGWILPETLILAELGLGHDDRARVPQPVRERLGPRFFDFQLAQSPEDSWKECALHARNLLGELGFAALERELAGQPDVVREPIRRVAEPVVPPYPPANQHPNLFDS